MWGTAIRRSMAAATVMAVAGFATAAQATSFDGAWSGKSQTKAGSCNGFEIWVEVDESIIAGKALIGDYSFDIKGQVTDEGRLEGKVSKVGFTVAELSGSVAEEAAAGTWRTVRGKDCSGTFRVRRN